LSGGQCYRSAGIAGIAASGSSSSSYSSVTVNDPLCEQFTTKCVKCTAGTYLSGITGKCKMRDPFADEFDEIREVAVRCVRGYTVVNGICTRK